MRFYNIRCPQCLWQSPMPVDEKVAVHFRGHRCKDCKAAGRPDVQFEVKEFISVGPVRFLPHRERKVPDGD